MMKLAHKLSLFAAILCLTASSAWAASDADTAFREGQKLLAQGDLRAALEAYKTAVKLDRDNQPYIQQYLMVQQVIKLQGALAKETNAQKWAQMAVALRSFFNTQGLHAQALLLDRAMWERSKTADNAVQLADTLLELQKSAEAVEVLASLEGPHATSATRALLAVALMREGKREEARQIAGSVRDVPQDDPGTLYFVARMHAAVGNADAALAALVQSFEAAPPSRLDSLKARVRTCADFSPIVSLASFATVMQTASKVPESKCSGGSSCSTCPMRGNCAHGEGK